MIEYIARAAESDYLPGDTQLVSLAEVLKAFVSVLGSVGVAQRSSSSSLPL